MTTPNDGHDPKPAGPQGEEEKSEAGGRARTSDPSTTVPRDEEPNTTVPRDDA